MVELCYGYCLSFAGEAFLAGEAYRDGEGSLRVVFGVWRPPWLSKRISLSVLCPIKFTLAMSLLIFAYTRYIMIRLSVMAERELTVLVTRSERISYLLEQSLITLFCTNISA